MQFSRKIKKAGLSTSLNLYETLKFLKLWKSVEAFTSHSLHIYSATDPAPKAYVKYFL